MAAVVSTVMCAVILLRYRGDYCVAIIALIAATITRLTFSREREVLCYFKDISVVIELICDSACVRACW